MRTTIEKKNKNITKSIDMMRQMREQNKFFFDNYHEIWNKKVKKNKIFLHDIQHEKNKNSQRKLNYKWKIFYQITEIMINKSIYFLIELNDIDLKSTFVDNRFKKFRFRSFSNVEDIKINFKIVVEKIFEKIFDFNNFVDFRKNLIFFEWLLTMIMFLFF